HIAATTPTTPIATDAQTCHSGGGSVEAMRISMPKVLIGGTKLAITDSVELGSREMGIQRNHGRIRTSISGVISDCASRMSLTAAPAAIISDPIVKNAIRKNK